MQSYLDKKDSRILHELDLDAQLPLNRLAKKVGVSSEVAAYRIKQLEKKGTLKGYYGIINVYNLDFQLFRIYLRLHRMPSGIKQEFLEYLNTVSQVGQISLTGGDYDLIIGIVEKTNRKFQSILDDIMNRYGAYIIMKDISIITELRQYSRKFILPSKDENVPEWIFSSDEKKPDVDSVDLKILSFLSDHGRSMSTDIERGIGVSRKVISYRLKRLRQEHIFLGSRMVLKRGAFGESFFRILIKLQTTNEIKIQRLLYYFKTHTAVVHWLKCLGSWDWEIEVAEENIEKCHSFVSELKDTFEIVRETTVIPLFNDLKYRFSITE
ncbi:MAG: Lrp/AsnC family transcriptional regulator [Nanoarchaeota archaeon]